MNKTVLAIGIIFLLIGVSAVTSTENVIEDDISYYNHLIVFDSQEELLFHNKTVYAWREPNRGPCYFKLNDPGNVTQLAEYMGTIFLSGGTWTNDGRWFGVDLFPGSLCEINPEDGSINYIGGGGNEINGLAYNPVNSKLYGAGSFCLYEINIDTGEHTYIGDYGEGPEKMIGIAFDLNGVLYGWDFFNDSLWNINTETGQASLIGPLGIDIEFYPAGGDFDFGTDILYLSAWTTTKPQSQLYECDEDTGQCKLVGDFKEQSSITALTIPYNYSNHPPEAPNINGPHGGKPGDTLTFTFSAVDPDNDYIRFHIDWDDGNTDTTCYVSSGDDKVVEHVWSKGGYYTIIAKAEDEYGAIGNETTFIFRFEKSKAINTPILNFLQSHPYLFPLLHKLIQRLGFGQ